MLQQAYDIEMEQRWKFENYVFFDEDVFLSYRTAANPGRVISNNTHRGFQLFNQILLRDQPMRTGISFNDHPYVGNNATWTAANYPCVRRCQIDNVVVAVHRTAVETLLPYSARFDSKNWWMSAYINNLFSSALAPKYCSYYREVLVELAKQVHGAYPRGEWAQDSANAIMFVGKCLGQSGFRDFNESFPIDAIGARLWHGIGPQPEAEEDRCVTNEAGVDFADELKPLLTNWPVTCI